MTQNPSRTGRKVHGTFFTPLHVSRHYLDKANQLASVSQGQMGEVILARQETIGAGAAGLFPKDLQIADNHLQDLTSEIEDHELKNVDKKRGELQREYISLEIKSLKQAHLSHAKETVNQAIDEGAEEFAPQTLAEAQKQIKDTDAFIYGYRTDIANIKSRSGVALASAEHVLQITRDAKQAKKITPEEIALRLELEKQQIASKQVELAQEKNTTKALVEENSTLAIERDFHKQFEEAQAEFAPREAEVYKQGNKLLIRLKGLEFPVAQALLKGSNFPLLTKVQKVINKFGKSSVIIEGHTDADGDKAMNEKLSMERALAVRDYLQSSLASNDIQLSAIGHGYQKPIASNKTPDGRAQNRRVDIVISPVVD